jgi:hypothetical protein
LGYFGQKKEETDIAVLRQTITKLRAENNELRNSSLVKANNSHTFITGVDSSNTKDQNVSHSVELITEENLM